MLQTYCRSFSFDLGRRRRVVDIDRADAGSELPQKKKKKLGKNVGTEGKEEEEDDDDQEEAEGLGLGMVELAVDVRDDDSLLLTRGMQQEGNSSSSSSSLAMVEPNRHHNTNTITLADLCREEKKRASSSSSSSSSSSCSSSSSSHLLNLIHTSCKSTKQKSQGIFSESNSSPSQRMNEFIKQLCSNATSSSSNNEDETYRFRNPSATDGSNNIISSDVQAFHSYGSSSIKIRTCSGNEPYSQNSGTDFLLGRCKSSTEFALESLRFFSKTTEIGSDTQWKAVEDRFYQLASTDGLLARADFGYCIGKSHNTLIQIGICSYW